jgi:uncharacterized protein (TIGR00369 family)
MNMQDEAIRKAFDRALNEPDSGATFLHRFMGVKIAVENEVSVVEFPYEEHFANRQKNLHGGIIALLFDIAMGSLHRVTLGPGVTLELKTQYLRSVQEGSLRCEARFLKKGRRISFMEAKMLDGNDKLVAAASATWALAE